MIDLTKDFENVCNAKYNIGVCSHCEDGSYGYAEYQYENYLSNLKHNIDGKDWVLFVNNQIEANGNSFSSLLEEEIKSWDYNNSYRFEIEE